jgi:hypothetical protein
MVKQVAIVSALGGLLLSVSAARSSARVPAAAQFAPRCLHGSSEQAVDQRRRQQALALARAVNQAENPIPRVIPPPPRPWRYRPLAELPDLPPPPPDFKMRFHTDGPGYMFSLKDTADPCQYAIFSDQDQGIYEGEAIRPGARIMPADIP